MLTGVNIQSTQDYQTLEAQFLGTVRSNPAGDKQLTAFVEIMNQYIIPADDFVTYDQIVTVSGLKIIIDAISKTICLIR